MVEQLRFRKFLARIGRRHLGGSGGGSPADRASLFRHGTVRRILISANRGASNVSTTDPTNYSARRLMPSTIGSILLGGLCLAASGCSSFAARGLNAEGVRLFEQARYEEAVQQFQQAIYNDSGGADGYYNLAECHRRLGTIHNRQSDLDLAESYYNQCLDRDEDHRECYRGLAVLLIEQNRSQEAFRLIEGWVDRNPMSPEPKVELARLFEEYGDRESAKEYLIEAVKIDPNHTRALTALGKVREEMGEHTQALANYRRSLSLDGRQAGVAARVAALQSTLGSSPLLIGPASGGTRTVSRGTLPLR